MDTAAARLTSEELDAIQVAQGRVRFRDFRLLPDCDDCVFLASLPATRATTNLVKDHIWFGHDDLVIN